DTRPPPRQECAASAARFAQSRPPSHPHRRQSPVYFPPGPRQRPRRKPQSSHSSSRPLQSDRFTTNYSCSRAVLCRSPHAAQGIGTQTAGADNASRRARGGGGKTTKREKIKAKKNANNKKPNPHRFWDRVSSKKRTTPAAKSPNSTTRVRAREFHIPNPTF